MWTVVKELNLPLVMQLATFSWDVFPVPEITMDDSTIEDEEDMALEDEGNMAIEDEEDKVMEAEEENNKQHKKMKKKKSKDQNNNMNNRRNYDCATCGKKFKVVSKWLRHLSLSHFRTQLQELFHESFKRHKVICRNRIIKLVLFFLVRNVWSGSQE